MDDVRRDCEARLAASASEHAAALASQAAQHEATTAATATETGSRIAALSGEVARLRSDVSNAALVAEKQRTTVTTLKEQLAAALVARDDLEREVS
jgi:hypothetical protein